MPVTLGSSRGFMGFPAAASTFDAATDAWVAAVIANGGSVSDPRKAIVDALIVGLKADGLFTKLDRLWLFAAEDQPSALTDIIADSLATAVNSPTFTVDRGYTGNASNMQVDTNFNATTATTPNFVQNSGSFFVWSNTSASDNVPAFNDQSDHTTIYPNQTGTAYFQVNATPYSTNAAVADGLGFYHANRSASNAEQGYKNGSSVASSAAASVAPANSKFFFLGAGANWAGQCCGGGFGASLDATEAGNLYSRLRNYMNTVEVPT